MPASLPMPTVQAFLTCNEIFVDPNKRATILVGPCAHVPVPKFPHVSACPSTLSLRRAWQLSATFEPARRRWR